MYIPPIVELVIRTIYFWLGFRGILERFSRCEKGNITQVSLKDLENRLRELGAKSGNDMMVYSSFSRVDADEFIDFLRDYIGGQVNRGMLTYPRLINQNGTRVHNVRNLLAVGYLSNCF